jgi:branched-chain amino acid transport system substrate-binding protein
MMGARPAGAGSPTREGAMLAGRFKGGLALAVAGLLLAGCSSNNSGASSNSAKPLVVGISLSSSGDFSDPSAAALKGYQLWADTVNANGGLMGRKVQLKVVDDTSSPDQVVTNYENLITKDKVAFVLGPFSTLLSAPAAKVASRYGYAFIEPAGGGPDVFTENLHNVFFTQPAPVVNSADVFAQYILSLPADQRPKTAAYPELDDPFAAPIAEEVRAKFEAAGIRTVFKQVYPAEMTDFTPLVAKMAAAKPDIVVAGTQSDDAFNLTKAMIQENFSPKYLFESNGANDPVNFPSKVGANNTEGIFSSGDWFPDEKSPGNSAFVAAYQKKYGSGPIDSTSAEAYAAGQTLAAAIAKTNSLDNAKIIAALHQGAWPSVEGNLSWNSIGEPQGSDLLVEWINQQLLPVYPPSVALHPPVIPKPPWGG